MKGDLGAWWRRLVPVLLVAGGLAAGVKPGHGQGWRLAWQDEFNGPANALPNPASWGYDLGGGGFGNGELQIYCGASSKAAPCDTARPNVFEDGHGKLVIEAVNRAGVWTSGRIKTQGKKEFQYGRIEARMRLPVGHGLWPAFWMLGSGIASVGWPKSGEHDIMEWVQSYGPSTFSSHVHGPGYSGKDALGASFTFPKKGQVDDGRFHVYGETWSPDRLEFYCDHPDRPFLTVTPANLPVGTEWVFNAPAFVLFDLAIGSGGFPGKTDATTPASAKMLVDWVRLYQRK